MKPLLGYYGGKAGPVGAWIAAQLPPHRVYVEPFGGMAGILMQKRPSPVEVYNDLAEELVNLFRVVREQPEALRCQLELTPYSRCEMAASRRGRKDAEVSELERARRTYTTLAQARDAAFKSSWSFGGPNFPSSVADAFVNGQARIPLICERLRRVQLDCKGWEDVVAAWDGPQTLIYLDPPYTEAERTALKCYAHEMQQSDQERLLDWCLGSKSMILISGYRNDLYAQKLELAGWLRRDYATISRSSAARGNRADSKKSARVESLWLNPAAAVATPQLFQ